MRNRLPLARCSSLYVILFLVLGIGCMGGVEVSSPTGFRSALTGDPCEPNSSTFISQSSALSSSNWGNESPTGIPGDNMDDTRSGKIDCYYDGNSGQGDDWKYPECQPSDFPQPGCDDEGCCDEEVLPGEDDDDAAEPPPEPPQDDSEPEPVY